MKKIIILGLGSLVLAGCVTTSDNQASSKVPSVFNIGSQTLVLKAKQESSMQKVASYTLKDENLISWTKFIALSYTKGVKVSPEQWKKLQLDTLNKEGSFQNPQFIMKNNNSYIIVTYLPKDIESKNPIESMYEVNVQKGFYHCPSLVFMSLAERFPANTKNASVILQKKRTELLKQLEAQTWVPQC